MGRELDTHGVARAYGRWAPVYDLVFGRVLAQGRRAAVEAAERVGGRVLEVGVGTGISLPSYRRSTRLVGVDISEPMLAKARGRVTRLGFGNIEDLTVMDAEPRTGPCDAALRKGQEMGWFEHGSTIVVLAPKGFALCGGVQGGARIRVGEPLMRVP